MADKGLSRKKSSKRAVAEIPLRRDCGLGLPGQRIASDYDIVSDRSKARRFGFHDLAGTEEMFLRMFADFRRERIIP